MSSAPAASAPANLLRNAGFEEGRAGWSQMGTSNWGAFEIVRAPTHSGAGAALLEIDARAGETTPPSRVFGVVQEIRGGDLPGDFPETLSGWYLVEEWEPPPRGAFLYLQVVAIVWGDPRAGRLTGASDIENYQVRFMLGGSAEAPFSMNNARYRFLETATPVAGRWTRFDIPLRKAFQEEWGVVPAGFEFVRVLFEARWDHRPSSAALRARVLYDDLFLGYGPAP